MKRILLFSVCLLAIQLLVAQKKSLPACTSIEKQLSEIDNSFENLIAKFKTTKKNSIFDQWNSDFSICGEKGTLQQIKGFPEFSFEYSGEKYKGEKSDFDSLLVRLGKQVLAFFKETHEYTIIEDEEGKSIRFFEIGKEMPLSGKSIRLRIDYKNEEAEIEFNSVSMVFGYIKSD